MQDEKQKEILVHCNVRMDSMAVARLSLCGWEQVEVIKELPIGILTVGDKLQELGEPLKPEHSYDSNRAILISLLKENSFPFFDFGISTRE